MKQLVLLTILALSVVSPCFAQKRLADRDVEGLKGEIKVVKTETADLKNDSGVWVESNRMPDSYITYDQNGNRVVEKVYEDGKLSSSGVYKLLDGDRVLVPDKIEIASTGRELIVTTGRSSTKPQFHDDRYTQKYKYKYDAQGTKREEIIYQNNGTYWQRRVVTLKGNQRDEQVYDEKGKFNQKYIYTLDDKGNEIEMLVFSPGEGSASWKENYKNLEFDSKGNWTKRIMSRSYNEDGKYLLRSTVMYYRTCTYY